MVASNCHAGVMIAGDVMRVASDAYLNSLFSFYCYCTTITYRIMLVLSLYKDVLKRDGQLSFHINISLIVLRTSLL